MCHKWPVNSSFPSFLLLSTDLLMQISTLIKKIYKGGFKSENKRQFFGVPKNIPKSYLKLVHPVRVHDIDKTSILNFFGFTSLTYLQVVQKGFQGQYQKSYIVKAFYTYRGFLPYATFGTWKKFALAKIRISKFGQNQPKKNRTNEIK